MKSTITAKEIQRLICKAEVLKFHICCENVKYVYHGECDVLSLKKSGYISEFEVKISKSDFRAEAKKIRKFKHYDMAIHSLSPNYFYYVCPDGMISADEIPKYAGLIYVVGYVVGDNGLKLIRKATLLHKKCIPRELITEKFSRILSERMYLGSCRMTYDNNRQPL